MSMVLVQQVASPEDEFSGDTLNSDINGLFDKIEKQDVDKRNAFYPAGCFLHLENEQHQW
jgi:hypothetical protein